MKFFRYDRRKSSLIFRFLVLHPWVSCRSFKSYYLSIVPYEPHNIEENFHCFVPLLYCHVILLKVLTLLFIT